MIQLSERRKIENDCPFPRGKQHTQVNFTLTRSSGGELFLLLGEFFQNTLLTETTWTQQSDLAVFGDRFRSHHIKQMKVAAIIFAQNLFQQESDKPSFHYTKGDVRSTVWAVFSGLLGKVGLFLSYGQEATFSRCYI